MLFEITFNTWLVEPADLLPEKSDKVMHLFPRSRRSWWPWLIK